MNQQTQKTILAGIVGTAVMSVVMMVAPMMGLPKMSPPEMLSQMLGVPIIMGWIMHFITGILFAFAYSKLCFLKSKINNIWVRGALFGVIAFVFAQIMLGIMGTMLPMPEMDSSQMMLTMIGSLMGHIIFGMAVAGTLKNDYCTLDGSQPTS